MTKVIAIYGKVESGACSKIWLLLTIVSLMVINITAICEVRKCLVTVAKQSYRV